MPATPSLRRAEIDAFLASVKKPTESPRATRGRGILAIDATMSRQETWDTACKLQSEMFAAVTSLGSLDLQLVYYRGLRECRASQWVSDASTLARLMRRIQCEGGETQIARVLEHTAKENDRQKVGTLIFVGDACEEPLDKLCALAGEVGRREIPALMFQEGRGGDANRAFKEIARLTKGAHCRFDSGAARQLAELLRGAAIFATGGLKALSDSKDTGAVRLLQQMK